MTESHHSIVGIISSPGVVKVHEGDCAELIWRFSSITIWERLSTILLYDISVKGSTPKAAFYKDEIWNHNFGDRAGLLGHWGSNRLGVQVDNISKADASQYMLSTKENSTVIFQDSNTVIYVFSKYSSPLLMVALMHLYIWISS